MLRENFPIVFFSEQDMLREEIRSLQTVKERLKQRVGELEEELKRVREEAERAAKVSKSDDEVRIVLLVEFLLW
jgi:uncharacterized protein YlxW (UPF0749 family)